MDVSVVRWQGGGEEEHSSDVVTCQVCLSKWTHAGLGLSLCLIVSRDLKPLYKIERETHTPAYYTVLLTIQLHKFDVWEGPVVFLW